ncbi:hypothetical protein JL720_4438 [Aureococcus anophagefferens]|nr:hypothetical protein JL720_4438 [Aureococcus anophagefferens]
MALDDGTFLTSPERFDASPGSAAAGATTEADAAAALEAEGLHAPQAFVRRCHRRARAQQGRTRVIQRRFNVPKFAGNPDPPLRSRFSCFDLKREGIATLSHANVGTAQDPADPTAVQLARPPTRSTARDADADAAAERAGGRDAKAALRRRRLQQTPTLLGLPVLDGLDGDALYRFATSASLDAGDGERRVVLRFETPSNSASRRHDAARRSGGRDAPEVRRGFDGEAAVVLSAMLRDHCAGIDVCLCGWRGVGKTAWRAAAGRAATASPTIFC